MKLYLNDIGILSGILYGKDYTIHSALSGFVKNEDYPIQKAFVLSNEDLVF